MVWVADAHIHTSINTPSGCRPNVRLLGDLSGRTMYNTGLQKLRGLTAIARLEAQRQTVGLLTNDHTGPGIHYHSEGTYYHAGYLLAVPFTEIKETI